MLIITESVLGVEYTENGLTNLFLDFQKEATAVVPRELSRALQEQAKKCFEVVGSCKMTDLDFAFTGLEELIEEVSDTKVKSLLENKYARFLQVAATIAEKGGGNG